MKSDARVLLILLGLCLLQFGLSIWPIFGKEAQIANLIITSILVLCALLQKLPFRDKFIIIWCLGVLGFSALFIPPIIDNYSPHQHKYDQTNDHKNTIHKNSEGEITWSNWRDFPIAVFTFWLGVFTLIIMFANVLATRFTQKTAIAAIQSAAYTRDAERAWIFPNILSIADSLDGRIASLAIKNHGKTPGIHQETYGEFSVIEPTGDELIYDGGKLMVYDHAIHYIAYDPRFGGFPAGSFVTNIETDHFFFGYIKYMDVFQQIHFSRFCCKVIIESNKSERAGSEAYNSFD